MMQRSVVKVVREKYLNQVSLEDQTQFQRFLSELYVFLVDQMHIGLRKVQACFFVMLLLLLLLLLLLMLLLLLLFFLLFLSGVLYRRVSAICGLSGDP